MRRRSIKRALSKTRKWREMAGMEMRNGTANAVARVSPRP